MHAVSVRGGSRELSLISMCMHRFLEAPTVDEENAHSGHGALCANFTVNGVAVTPEDFELQLVRRAPAQVLSSCKETLCRLSLMIILP